METIKGVCFDLYGTLVDIETDEGMEEIYRGLAHFLTYHGVHLHRFEVREQYWAILKENKKNNPEPHSEINVEAIWSQFLQGHKAVGPASRKRLALILAQMFRGIARKRLQLYPGVLETLDALKGRFALGLVSDAQPCWALPELAAVGLEGYFPAVAISAPHGFRKPDPRMFSMVLKRMGASPEQAIFVGNDMYHDIFGAQQAGLFTVFFASGQGAQQYADIEPDYRAASFEDVLKAIDFLSAKAAGGPSAIPGKPDGS